MQFEQLDLHTPVPLSLQLAKIIENKIKNKELIAGQKLPTQPELRKIFEVSNNTIKVALSSLVEAGYISRRPNYGTVVISSEPKNRELLLKNGICLVFCSYSRKFKKYPEDIGEFSHPGTQILIGGIEAKLKEKGIFLMYNVFNKKELDLTGKENDLAGIIITGEITRERFKAVKKLNIPSVLLGDILQKTKTEENIDVIADDDFMAGHIATKHLTDLGHRKIVYLARKTESFWDEETLKGYKKVLKENKVDIDENLILEINGWNIEDGYKIIKEFLEKSVDFTAMVTIGDLLCVGAARAIKEHGMEIPGNISMVNIGVSQELTRIAFDPRRMGNIAVDRLVEKILNPDLKPERIVVTPKLIDQGSTSKIGG